MAALAAEHDVHVTFNLTPVLLRQIDDYLQNGATDSALELTRRPAEKLTKAQVEEVLSTFFDADWHQQVYIHSRFRELFEQRTSGARFHLAWFGHEFRAGDVRLITGIDDHTRATRAIVSVRNTGGVARVCPVPDTPTRASVATSPAP